MTTFLTSKAMERATNLSGSYLRRLVKLGVIDPERDTTGRYLYTFEHLAKVSAYRERSQSRDGSVRQ